MASSAIGGQGVEPELRVIGLAGPSHADNRGGTLPAPAERAAGRLSTRRSRTAWVSVSIQCRFSTTRSSRLDLTLPQPQALEGVQGAPAALRGLERLP